MHVPIILRSRGLPTYSATVPAITPTLGAELLTNGGMETGDPPTGWTAADATLSANADVPTGGGSQSLSIVTTRNAWGGANQTPVSVIGTWYQVSVSQRKVTNTAKTYFGSWMIQNATTAWVTGLMCVRATATNHVAQCRVDAALIGEESRHDNFQILPLTFSTCVSAAVNTGPYGRWSVTPTLTSGTQCGLLCCANAALTSFVMAYPDGTNVNLVKCVAGTYTSLIATAATYGAARQLQVRRAPGTNTFSLWYSDGSALVQIGADQTISDAQIINNTDFRGFSTYATNTCGTAAWSAV